MTLVIDVDGVSLSVMYTPGHTNDSYSYLMGDRVFTGDTLLIRGTGRTDFQHGDAAAAVRAPAAAARARATVLRQSRFSCTAHVGGRVARRRPRGSKGPLRAGARQPPCRA